MFCLGQPLPHLAPVQVGASKTFVLSISTHRKAKQEGLQIQTISLPSRSCENRWCTLAGKPANLTSFASANTRFRLTIYGKGHNSLYAGLIERVKLDCTLLFGSRSDQEFFSFSIDNDIAFEIPSRATKVSLIRSSVLIGVLV